MLEICGLSLMRGGVRLLEDINLSFQPGEAGLIIGKNGIGKTSLLRAIAGLGTPQQGEVLCDPDDLAYIAFQGALKPSLTAYENLLFWAKIYSSDINPVKALREMQLEGIAEFPVQHLSSGQKRRLALCRLLIVRRKIWLLDEPTIALDRASITLFSNILKTHLSEDGIALIANHAELPLPDIRYINIQDYTPQKQSIGAMH